jgi:sialate O-acetylesterase
VREFSAACYYFGRALQPHLGVAVGLINDSWGGTVIEAWLGEQEIRAVGGYEKQLAVMADYTRAKEQALRRWREDSNAWWKAHDPGSAASPAWYDPAYDDSHWAQIVPAGDWEGWGVAALTDFDGIVWFRKTVTLSAAQTKGNAVLSLGPVDDVDSTWVNGKSVGAREGWDTPRVYTLPAGTLHEGVNVIAVGVLDLGAGGGMWGPASAKTLKLGDGSVIALDTPWRYKISAPLSQTGSIPHAPWLPESGLSMLYNGMIAPLGFQLCDAAMQCRFADAALTGNSITHDRSQMPDAVVLRFCWADSPICNLYNSAGLPATPFEMPIGDARE